MKLNKYLFSTFIAASTLLISSCSDFLDRSPQGQFTEDDNPNALVNGKIYNVYTMMRSFDITAGTPAIAIHYLRSEDSEKGSIPSDGSDVAEMYDDFLYTPTNGLLGSYWGKNYAIIYQCNDILDAIAEKETAGQTETEDIINKGEASFFRAYCYFNLVRAFGEVPLVTYKINDASEANIPKTTADKIYEQIDTDLKTAEESLPETWSTEYTGRLTWGAARSLHARTYMMRSDWDNMYKASTDVINKGLYNLKTPYNEIFTDDGENSGGSIFELQCTATAALPQSDVIGSQFCEVQGVRGAGQWDLGWGWHMATQLMADAYETGDPRKNATLLYFRKTDDEPITPENTNEPYGESPVSPAMGAYFNKKAYTDPALRKEYTNKGFWVNIRLIRYSDVVLMAAEAANEKNIPIFLMDTSTLPDEGEYVTRIGTVNYDGGMVGGMYAGQYLLEQGRSEVDAVALHSGDQVSVDRRDGILAGLEAAGVSVNMLNEYHSASREESMANFEDAMTTYAKIDLVVATSAQHGMGAYSAAEAAGRTEMLIAAYDGEAEEMEAIDNGTGTYLCTVTQDPVGMSETIAQQVEDYIFNGATYEQFQSAPAGVYGKDGQLSAADLSIG